MERGYDIDHGEFLSIETQYVLRTQHYQQQMGKKPNSTAANIAQSFIMRIIRGDDCLFRSFPGTGDRSVLAFLTKITIGEATDYHQRECAVTRPTGQVSSISEIGALGDSPGTAAEWDVVALLSWLNVQRPRTDGSDRNNAGRDVLLLKDHYIEVLTGEENAECTPDSFSQRLESQWF